MLVKKGPDLTYADVTPKKLYMGRRNFLMGVLATGGAVEAYKSIPGLFAGRGTGSVPEKLNVAVKSPFSTTEPVTSEEIVTHYNNFYEFGTDKGDPAKNSKNFITSPWSVKIEGEVKKPRTLSMDEILKLAPLEERIYRHRCVEAWSIVVPWIGYSLSTLLKQVEPNSKAKYVAFESYYTVNQMPEGPSAGIELPYVEGLRMDEAMHPLTLLCVGMYGETLPNQDGAPVRIVVPWKYGFKSIKSLVKIRFVKDQPPTTWNLANAHEYGFYSNVNPQVDHPRWSQKTEHRLGGGFFSRPIPTQMFNGYGDQVASLYAGMDLRKYY
ncbi:MAG TPA: protein-methionine-sulfoxide reductase catalytic subunit MsrP [Candidatus Acidoferrales bacterium]|nr:protein-methionine-sulfoxide reductase catalytic subunit MsrP [Candidatus Acidoferrales bacterium]